MRTGSLTAGRAERARPTVRPSWRLPGLDAGVAWLGASRTRFSVAIATMLVLAYNLPFWRGSYAAVGSSPGSVAFLTALAVMLVAVHAWLLSLVPGRRLPAWVAAALFAAASIVLHYEVRFDVYFDSDMVRNVFETDAAEARDVIGPALIATFVLLGLLPAAVVARVRLPAVSWPRRIGEVALSAAGTVVLVGGLSLAFSSHLAPYLREHKPLRYLVNPLNVIYGGVAVASANQRADQPFEYVEGNVRRIAAAHEGKPLLVLLVVGETARAASFELGGYARETNPRLRGVRDLVWFGDASSCGTSTATSIPCLFSHVGREDFDVDAARYRSNLLDAAVRGGVDVEWRDNNSGCKHVCDRVETVDFRTAPANAECADGRCYDEVVTGRLGSNGADGRDALVVVHQAGSHGPAYFERYPAQFAKFTPDCRTAELSRCERAEIVNAYDNSILYTDFVLEQQIERLRALQDRYDTLLLYVSDHGESLGENGVYLHAAPYFMAPSEQTHVPMLLWASEGYRQRAGLDLACLQQRAALAADHDDVYHTVLGALGLSSEVYRPERDLLAGCRSGW